MTANLESQRRHQVRLARKRMTWWIPMLFASGLGVSILGLVPSVADFNTAGSLTPSLLVFAVFTLLFGWAVVMWLFQPLLLRPRIVPYFRRELGKLGGETMAAFRGGRGLYLEIVSLDALATSLGVTPMSAFGFAYDHYEQEVRWHAASDGLRTAEALRERVGAQSLSARVAQDLDALAATLRSAAEQRVEFSLVLRLHASDSIQAVSGLEERQGAFW